MNEPLPQRNAKRYRALVLASSGILALALGGIGVAAADASTSTPTPTPRATSTPTSHAGHEGHHHAGKLRAELRVLAKGGTNFGDKAQVIATEIVDGHAKLLDKLPSKLKADLTTLKNDAEAQRAGDASEIKKTALSGGYGAKIEALAKKIESRDSGTQSK